MNIIIIGATSGIGKELCNLYIKKGNTVGITGRRKNLLEQIYSSNPQKTFYQVADVTNIEETNSAIQTLCQQMGSIDIAIVCAGTGDINPELEFEKEYPTLQTNIIGWTHIVGKIYSIFEKQGYGNLVTITSIGGLRGEHGAPAYSASKAFQINYTEALRKKAYKSGKPIYVTDIRPGFVDTDMAKGDGLFWVMPVEKVAHQISKAIQGKVAVKVVTKRWSILAFIIKHLPYSIYKRI